MMSFIHDDRQGFAFPVGRFRCFSHLPRTDGVGWTVYKEVAKLAKHWPVEIDPVKPARSCFWSRNTSERDEVWIGSHTGSGVGQQAFFQQLHECGLADTSWADHEHDGAWSAGQHLFPRRTYGVENGVERFQEAWMRNYATQLKILLAYCWRLQQQGSVKKLRLLRLLFFLIWGSVRLFLVHGRILLNTRSLSGFFSGGVSETAGREGTSAGEDPSEGAATRFPPSRTFRAVLVSRSVRCWRKMTSFAAFSRRKSASCFWVISTCSRPYWRRLFWRSSEARSCSSRSEQPANSS